MKTALIAIALVTGFMTTSLMGQDSHMSQQIAEIVVLKDTVLQKVVRDPHLYTQHWDTLAQARFWRKIITLSPDISVLNVAATREILHYFPTEYYDTLTNESKKAFKDSMRTQYQLPLNTPLYVTYGKSDFYKMKKVLPSIDRGIEIFVKAKTDPWYAQTILLIESPGQLRQSPRGAYGPFQLMKWVAIQNGLVVNREVDEREDFDKAAKATARFLKTVCIPETRSLLKSWRLSFDESDLWFRLMVLHVYHAGAGNVRSVMRQIRPRTGGMELIRKVWTTRTRQFRNASQNYSQVALASLLELEKFIYRECNVICEAPGMNSGTHRSARTRSDD